MEEQKPRLSRLTALLTQLQSKRILTARELAEKHQVSIRTIYRDIRTLEASGIPIVTEEGRGYSLVDGFNLPPVMFSEDEANALITAEQLIATNKDSSFTSHYKNALLKIKAVLQTEQQEKTELLSERIVIRKTEKEHKTSDFLMQLQAAITNYQLTTLDYHSLQGATTQRSIEPFAIYSTQNNWLLIAFCRLRNEFRAFRLDHMLAIKVGGTVFEPHQITLQEYFNSCQEKL